MTDQQAEKQSSFKSKALKGLGIAVLLLGALFFLYRWAGTEDFRGTVQRVYEQEAEYRVELVDLDGNVHVTGNSEIRFPYFKLDTADLHAELNRLAQTGDVVDVKVWGFRMSWFSMFPNLISIDFVKSSADRRRHRAEAVADAVIGKLIEKDFLKGGDGIKPELVEVIEEALKKPDRAEPEKSEK